MKEKPSPDGNVVEAIKAIMDSLNHLGNDKAVLAAITNTVRQEHRTLQQQFWSNDATRSD